MGQLHRVSLASSAWTSDRSGVRLPVGGSMPQRLLSNCCLRRRKGTQRPGATDFRDDELPRGRSSQLLTQDKLKAGGPGRTSRRSRIVIASLATLTAATLIGTAAWATVVKPKPPSYYDAQAMIDPATAVPSSWDYTQLVRHLLQQPVPSRPITLRDDASRHVGLRGVHCGGRRWTQRLVSQAHYVGGRM